MTKPVTVTAGARLLRGFLKKNSITQADAAEAIGVSNPTVHDWLVGSKRPRPMHRKAIAVWTSAEVPAASWESAREEQKVANVQPFSRAQ